MDQKSKEAADILAAYFSQALKKVEALERELLKEKKARVDLEKRVRQLERGDG